MHYMGDSKKKKKKIMHVRSLAWELMWKTQCIQKIFAKLKWNWNMYHTILQSQAVLLFVKCRLVLIVAPLLVGLQFTQPLQGQYNINVLVNSDKCKKETYFARWFLEARLKIETD